MSYEKRIYRLQPDMPGGLDPLPIDPAGFVTVPEAQNWHVAYGDDELGLNVGVWDTTTMQEPTGPYPGDEFVVVIEGAFEMVDAEGGAVPAAAGQSVIFRNGAPVGWKQQGYLRKFFLLYEDPRAEAPRVDSPEGGVMTVDPDAPLSDADLTEGTATPQRDRVLFTNDHGNMQAGIWDTQAFETDVAPFPWHELSRVVEGEVTITEADGTAHTFRPGDVFFIPQGTPCRWSVPTYLKKHYATLDATIRPGG